MTNSPVTTPSYDSIQQREIPLAPRRRTQAAASRTHTSDHNFTIGAPNNPSIGQGYPANSNLLELALPSLSPASNLSDIAPRTPSTLGQNIQAPPRLPRNTFRPQIQQNPTQTAIPSLPTFDMNIAFNQLTLDSNGISSDEGGVQNLAPGMPSALPHLGATSRRPINLQIRPRATSVHLNNQTPPPRPAAIPVQRRLQSQSQIFSPIVGRGLLNSAPSDDLLTQLSTSDNVDPDVLILPIDNRVLELNSDNGDQNVPMLTPRLSVYQAETSDNHD